MTSARRRALAAAVVGAVVVAVVAWLVLRDANPRSAELGDAGVRTFDAAPDDLPEGIVPAGATEVDGTVSSGPSEWTAAVTFVTPGSWEPVQEHVDGVLRDAGFAFQQRSYDDVTRQELYAGPEGRTVSVTHQTIDDGTGTAVVMQGSR